MKMMVVMAVVIMVIADEETEVQKGEVSSQATLLVGGRVSGRTRAPVLSLSFFHYTTVLLQ